MIEDYDDSAEPNDFAKNHRIFEAMAIAEQKWEKAMFYQRIRHIGDGLKNPEWSN